MHGRLLSRIARWGAVALCTVGVVSQSAQAAPVPLPRPGACCVRAADGTITCVVTSGSGCNDRNGVFRGRGTTCQGSPCANAFNGACCLISAAGLSTCEVVSQNECARRGGRFIGPRTSCHVRDVCVPTGGCCVPPDFDGPFGDGPFDGVTRCVITTAARCASRNGIYQGDNSVCNQAACAAATGACCVTFLVDPDDDDDDIQDGRRKRCHEANVQGLPRERVRCFVVTQALCASQEGTFSGNGTTCDPNPCEGGTGACCVLTNGTATCSVLSLRDCRRQGGVFRGLGMTCAAGCANLPQGACCFPSSGTTAAGCRQADQLSCQAGNGAFRGAGAACDPSPCPPNGACCILAAAGPVCVSTTEVDCRLRQGGFRGASVACDATICLTPPPFCPCDVNGDGQLTGADLQLFVDNWVAGHGDYDNDGDTDDADLAAFTACYLGTPAGC